MYYPKAYLAEDPYSIVAPFFFPGCRSSWHSTYLSSKILLFNYSMTNRYYKSFHPAPLNVILHENNK